MYTLTGLSPGTKYEVWVVPLTTSGNMGEESNHETFTTSQSQAPLPDTSTSATPSTNIAVILASSIMILIFSLVV